MITDLKILQGQICPYCGKDAKYVDSAIIYGKSYGYIYLCKPCDAWVGVHKDAPTLALGRLANPELREWKKKAHDAFDPIWKDKVISPRPKAYTWLAQQLKIHPHMMHIGYLDIPECRKVVEVCNKLLQSK